MDVVIALAQCPYLDVNWQDNEGNTALITAVQAGTKTENRTLVFHNWYHQAPDSSTPPIEPLYIYLLNPYLRASQHRGHDPMGGNPAHGRNCRD